jgi:hypothetical protein
VEAAGVRAASLAGRPRIVRVARCEPGPGPHVKGEIMPDSFKKRQKEALRLEKQRDKAAKRMHRKEAARGGGQSESSPQNDSNLLETGASESVAELESDRNQVSLPGSTAGSLRGMG